jgi:hypothetical protein
MGLQVQTDEITIRVVIYAQHRIDWIAWVSYYITGLRPVFIYERSGNYLHASIATRTTSAEGSALVVRNCHSSQLDMFYGPRS